MKSIDFSNSFEKHICDKANALHIPIGGTFELLPTCNMNCKMCYVRLSHKEMLAQGNLLPKEKWFEILESAKEAGLLFLLLTGGEPLLYPDFKEIYLKAKSLGLVVCINTNGTLIDEEMADFLAMHKPRRLNISIYGSSNDTYAKLCDNPKGFDQFNNAIQLLKERNIAIKLNCSLSPWNYDDLEEMIAYAKENDIFIEIASYMFPPFRKNKLDNSENRLSIEQEVEARIYYEKMMYDKESFDKLAKAIVYCNDNDVEFPDKLKNRAFNCRSGSSTYWINWQGELVPCGMFNEPRISVLNKSVKDAFNEMYDILSQYKRSDECYNCKKEYICHVCAASALAETGKINGVSKHHCDACDLYIDKLRKYLKDNNINIEDE